MTLDPNRGNVRNPMASLLARAIDERSIEKVYEVSRQCCERYRDVAACIDLLEMISVGANDATRELVLASLSELARDFYPAIDLLASFLDDQNDRYSRLAAHIVAEHFAKSNYFPRPIARAMHCLLDAIPSDVESQTHEELLSLLRDLGMFTIRTERANTVLGPLLYSADHMIRYKTCIALSRIAVPSVDIVERLLACAKSETGRVHLYDTEYIEVWDWYIRCLIKLCPNDGLLIETLLSQLDLEDTRRLLFVVHSIAELGKRAAPAVPHLERLLIKVDGNRTWRHIARAIESIKTASLSSSD